MNNVYDKLKEMGIVLPSPPPKGGIYSPVKEFGRNYLYCSGCGPEVNGHNFIGKLGSDFTVEEGQMAAKNCLLNLLANLDQYLGDLNRIIILFHIFHLMFLFLRLIFKQIVL